MTALHTVLTVIQVILAVAMVAIVTLQSGKSAGLSSAIAGSDNSFMGKNKSKALDAKLASATKWIGAAFLVLTFVLNLFYDQASAPGFPGRIFYAMFFFISAP